MLGGPAEIKDGRLYLGDVDHTEADGNGTAKYSLKGYDVSGNWYVSFKYKSLDAPGKTNRGENVLNIQFGGDAGGGSVIGGGGNSMAGTTVGGEAGAGSLTPVKPIEKDEEAGIGGFADLNTVAWAEESINEMSKLGIVNGDGDGNFYPNRAVTREEVLKMALEAVGIEPVQGELPFTDVDPNAWYYGYVAAAYQAGIVNGLDDTTFGIGAEITRADMAVILMRILDYTGIEFTAEENAFVFDDFDSIPKYARESITLLCQAGLMNGVGGNRFDAGASATRAESAVAIYRAYNYIAERR